jgi:hypothetical protein
MKRSGQKKLKHEIKSKGQSSRFSESSNALPTGRKAGSSAEDLCQMNFLKGKGDYGVKMKVGIR